MTITPKYVVTLCTFHSLPTDGDVTTVCLAVKYQLFGLLRCLHYGPHDGELIVLHMIPKSAWGRSERYLTGSLQTVAGRTWINGGGNVASPAELRKHYDLRWLRLPEDTI